MDVAVQRHFWTSFRRTLADMTRKAYSYRNEHADSVPDRESPVVAGRGHSLVGERINRRAAGCRFMPAPRGGSLWGQRVREVQRAPCSPLHAGRGSEFAPAVGAGRRCSNRAIRALVEKARGHHSTRSTPSSMATECATVLWSVRSG